MTRSLLAILGVLLFTECLAAADPDPVTGLAYSPPAPPSPPDPANLVLRLIGITIAGLLCCVSVIWLARRANKVPGTNGDGGGRIKHEGTLPLDRRSSVHLIRVDGHLIAVTTDVSGLRSIVVLTEPFEKVLVEAEKEGPQPER